MGNKEQKNNYYYLNICPLGKLCPFAHSQEEIDYHPNQYKTHTCSSVTAGGTAASSRSAWKTSSSNKTNIAPCTLRDVCPNYHPCRQSQLQQHYSQEGRQFHSRYTHYHHHHHQQHQQHHYGDYNPSSPLCQPQQHYQSILKPLPIAPMIYISPAPTSDFEKSLLLPGLRELFRQRSFTVYSYICRSSNDSSKNIDTSRQQQQQKQNDKDILVPYTLFGNVSGSSTSSTII